MKKNCASSLLFTKIVISFLSLAFDHKLTFAFWEKFNVGKFYFLSGTSPATCV